MSAAGRPSGDRIGVYGGTFDPPHLAHLVVADRALTHLALDRVLFVPCGTPALKRATHASRRHRHQMTSLAIADRPSFEISDLELRRAGVSYTVDTLEALTAARPDAEWWLIVGSDAVGELDRWRAPERILALARLAVPERPGDPLDEVLARLPEAVRERVERVPMPALAIASRSLRADLAAGRSIRYLVPDPVIEYIAKHQLYLGA